MKAGANYQKPPIELYHSKLRLLDPEGSLFKVHCPCCPDGIMVVRRNEKTYNLISFDNCLLCGQHYIYLDETIGGEKVVG